MRVAAGVVLPIPMSPATSTSAPASAASSASRCPSASAAVASATVIASSRSMDPLPRRMRSAQTAGSMPSRYDGSASTLTSTMRTVAPTCLASTLAAAPPVTKFATICAVTSGG